MPRKEVTRPNNALIRSCPACRTSKSRTKGQKNNYELLLCCSCGTVYTEVLPEANIPADYDSYYTEANLSDPAIIHERLDHILQGFSSYRRNNRLLDIGCGAGSILRAAGRAGWKAEGLDVSRTAIDHIRSEGFEAFLGQLSEAQYPTGHFDVVTASELFEHVPDTEALIAEVARILRPGGLCWATTPHAGGLSARVLGLKWSVISPPEHLHLFSVQGIEKLLLKHGFNSVRVRTEGFNPVEIIQAAQFWKRVEDSSFAGAERVRTGYQINETLSSNRPLKAIKGLANGALRISHLGDSLKIWAER